MTDLYEELYLSQSLGLEDIKRILAKQRRDWTARSDAMPEEASRMLGLIDEADAAFATDESRVAYDAVLAASRQPVVDPDRDALRQADYERFCAVAAEYYDTNEFDLAEVAIGSALKNAPASGADLTLCRLAADTYFALGKYDPALTYLNQAIVLTPGDPELYLYKFRVAAQLGKVTPDDRRGSRDALANTLRITIGKAETAGDDPTLAQALDALAWLTFCGQRNPEVDAQSRFLATRALALDPGLSQSTQIITTFEAEALKLERERRLQAIEAMINVAGGPVWALLDVDQDYRRALFIAKDIIAQKPYHDEDKAVTWAVCSLRYWLNVEFFNSLPAQVRSRVIEVTNHNADNAQYGTTGGAATQDRVFLLSLDEVGKYFKTDSSRVARFNGSVGWWWLRSPGGDRGHAAYVSYGGGVYDIGSSVSNDGGGVRPALFLNLDA